MIYWVSADTSALRSPLLSSGSGSSTASHRWGRHRGLAKQPRLDAVAHLLAHQHAEAAKTV